MADRQPTLFVVAGANGAGKSTHSRDLLPENMKGSAIWDFDIQFNELKKQLMKEGLPAKEAYAKANDQVNDSFNDLRTDAMKNKLSFAYEGHFTGGSQWQPLLEAKQQGYFLHMVYLGLSDENKSVERVNERSKSGGHYVSEAQARFNYYGNMDMLDRNLKLPHKVDIYQNDNVLDHICTIERGIVAKAPNKIPEWIKKDMPELNALLQAHLLKIKNEAVRKISEDKSGQKGPKF